MLVSKGGGREAIPLFLINVIKGGREGVKEVVPFILKYVSE